MAFDAVARRDVRDRLVSMLRSVPDDVLAGHRVIDLPAAQPPWVDTGLTVHAGDQVTTVLNGRVYFDEANDKWLDASLQVWFRVGGRGPIRRGSRATDTFTAPHDGTVEVGNVHPGEWADRDGTVTIDPSLYGFMTGGTTVAVLRWAAHVEPAPALRSLAARGDVDGLLAGEADRLDGPPGGAPAGWEPLWYLGPTEVFTSAPDGSIGCSARNTFAIIRHDVDLALTPDTTVSWAWRMDRLPSEVAEDSFATHDYLSLAVEFDDGLDLTYQWSASLAPETSYRCPLPHWSERETHLVVRTGTAELGQWVCEERRVHEDRAAAIGGPDPARVSGVWLIAVSFLQHGEGRCEYANISVADGQSRRDIATANTPV